MPRSTHIPKQHLVDIILDAIPNHSIRDHFNIAEDTNLSDRLESFTKQELVTALIKGGGEEVLAQAEALYALYGPPTLYLVNIHQRPKASQLSEIVKNLSEHHRHGGLVQPDGAAISNVYVSGLIQNREHNTIEIPINYEKKIDYVNPDPSEDGFGIKTPLYSLERAFIWLPESSGFGIVVCRDFSAFRLIIQFGEQFLNLNWNPPNIPDSMLHRLAAGGTPRTATFFSRFPDTSEFDVQSLTVSDPSLSKRSLYTDALNDEEREQTSGFYRDHPALAEGGVGISTHYGRIWTPVHLDQEQLLRLGLDIIERTSHELDTERTTSRINFVKFYGNRRVKITNKLVSKKGRRYFDFLAAAVLESQHINKPIPLNQDVVFGLLSVREELNLYDFLEFDCPNCGPSIARSRNTNTPYIFVERDKGNFTFKPIGEDVSISSRGSVFVCECGERVEYQNLFNHIRIVPGGEFLSEMTGFLNSMRGIHINTTFYIQGNSLRVVNKPTTLTPKEIKLAELRQWRRIAHIHQRPIPNENQQRRAYSALKEIKEKCSRDKRHPSRETCDQCLASQITVKRLETPSDICLPRIIGLAINQPFDGVHHGHEGADVKYTDAIHGTGQNVYLGIHLKSCPRRQQPNGVGRSISQVKGLFTQLAYSAYVASIGGERFNIIGVSMPNNYAADVRAALSNTATGLGFPILILDIVDWTKIYEAAHEVAELSSP